MPEILDEILDGTTIILQRLLPATKLKRGGREKERRPDVCVNRLNCRAASPDYFFALIFSLLTATSPLPVTLTNPSIASLKYATKIGCYLLLWQPININRLHEDSSGILDVLMQSLKKKKNPKPQKRLL